MSGARPLPYVEVQQVSIWYLFKKEPLQWETREDVAASIAAPVRTGALELTLVPNRKSICKGSVDPAMTNAAKKTGDQMTEVCPLLAQSGSAAGVLRLPLMAHNGSATGVSRLPLSGA